MGGCVFCIHACHFRWASLLICSSPFLLAIQLAFNLLRSAANPTASSRRNMESLLHVVVGGRGCLCRIAAALPRAQVGRIPVRPAMFAVCLLVLAVVLLRFAEELCKRGDVHGSCAITSTRDQGPAM